MGRPCHISPVQTFWFTLKAIHPLKWIANSHLWFTFNPSWPGLPELHKGLVGGGRSALPLKKKWNVVKNQFSESLPKCVVHKNNNSQDWFCKRKVAWKKLRRKNPRGADLPPPPGQLGSRTFVLFWLESEGHRSWFRATGHISLFVNR